MENIIEAEYTVVPERTLDVIAAEIRTIDNHMCQVAINGAIEIGNRLTEAKEKIGHGNWENWCKENLNYTASWASKLMKISTEYGTKNSPYLEAISKTDTCADFSISKALRLLQVPEEEMETFAEENEIADMTVKELEEKIRLLNEEKLDKEKEIDRLKERCDESVEAQKEKLEEIDRLQEEIESLKAASEESLEDHEVIKEKEDLLQAAEKEKTELEEKNRKLKEKLDKAKEEQQKEIDEAIEKVKTEAKEEAAKEKEAELENLKKAAEEAEKEKELALKKLDQSSNEDVMKFKLHIDQLQEIFMEVKNDIENVKMSNADQADRMKIATKTVMEQLMGRIE